MQFYGRMFVVGVLCLGMNFVHSMEPNLVEESAKQVIGDREFIKEELEMLEGKELTVWGIGLFAGADTISGTIRKLTDSSWSHVALILKDQGLDLYCFESTSSYDQVIYQHVLPQVQIHDWIPTLNGYKGTVAYRQLQDSTCLFNDPKFVTPLVKKFLGRPYEQNVGDLIDALTGKSKKSDVSSLFCSELVAEMLQEIGYLDRNLLSDNFLPKHFSTEFPLPIHGGRLGDEVIVKGKMMQKGECFGKCCCTIL